MPRGSKLTEHERGQIDAFKLVGKTYDWIATKLGRSKKVVWSYLNDRENYGKKKSPGRPRKVSKRDERQIWRKASNSTKTAKAIGKEAGVNVSKWTIARAIKRNPNLVRAKMAKIPKIKKHHEENRVEFGRRNMQRNWNLVIVMLVYCSVLGCFF